MAFTCFSLLYLWYEKTDAVRFFLTPFTASLGPVNLCTKTLSLENDIPHIAQAEIQMENNANINNASINSTY